MTRQQTLDKLRHEVQKRIGEVAIALGHDVPIAFPDRVNELTIAAQRAACGSYGHCVACDRPIPLARLRAKPEAVRCIQCQENHERTHDTRRSA